MRHWFIDAEAKNRCMTRCREFFFKYLLLCDATKICWGHFKRLGGDPLLPLTTSPASRLPPSPLLPPPSAFSLPPILSLASCLLSFVSPLHHPLPLYPSPTETLIAGGWEKLTAGGIEDDQHVGITSRWAERGEFDLQKRGRMTAGLRGATLTSRRGGG